MTEIRIDAATTVAPLPHFWESTGFTPATLLLTPEMRQTLQYIGGVARKGIKYVRIHWLLELVSAKNLGTDAPIYDWSRLDEGLDLLIDNGLRPFFELMGNPSGYWTDWQDKTQIEAWARLVRDLALRYIERYGLEEVRTWYFETWNEPDIPNGWWKHGDAALLNYYDACSEGLKQADPKLVFGGPGTCRQLSDTLKALLAHCDNGTNVLTGETGVRMDFISVHEKGMDSSSEDLDPDTGDVMQRTQALIDYIAEHHLRLKDVPVMNNECDPQVGWADIHTWRGKPYYAAWVANLTARHLGEIRNGRGVDFSLLGNDNGFLGGWGKRTQLALFGKKEQIEAGRFELLKKPVLNLMTFLAMLGDTQIGAAVDGVALEDGAPPAGPIGVIASRREEQIALLVYHSRDKIMSDGQAPVQLTIAGLEEATYRVAHWRLDEEHGDSFGAWARSGKPWEVHAERLAATRAHQEPALIAEPADATAAGGALSLAFDLPLHGTSLILLTPDPKRPPAPVTGLRAETYQGLTERENVLLRWDDASGEGVFGLRTYEVLYAPTGNDPFERVNEQDLLDTTYLHVRAPNPEKGHYMIRAVDQWGRASDTIQQLTLGEVED